MTNETFLETLDDFYQRYEEESLWRNSNAVGQLEEYLAEHAEEEELNIPVNIRDYKIVDGFVYFDTDIGTFFVEQKDNDIAVLESLKNSSISFLDFFYKLDVGNLSDTFSKKIINDLPYSASKQASFNLFHHYLIYYYNYRNLTDPNMIGRLFKSYNNDSSIHTIISFEALDNPDFHGFCGTSLKKVDELKKIYDQYHSFDQNPNLIFSLAVLSEDYDKVEYLEEHLTDFKKFIIEEASSATYLSGYNQICCDYLKKSNLIYQFTDDELLSIYKKNTSYYILLPDIFQETVAKLENKSPMIYLDATQKEKVHIRYFSYQLIDNVPFNYHLKYNIHSEDRLSFKNLFLYNNKTISQFYSMYYKKYQSELGKEGNLYDFIGYLFQTKTLYSIYNNPSISVATVHELEQFLPLYNKKIQQGVTLVKDELRKRNFNFYNSVSVAKEDPEKLDKILLQSGLSEENIYSFVLQNKFLDKKKKEGLLRIFRCHFADGFNVADILSIIDEAQSRCVSLDTVLEEKEIGKREFQKMYEDAEEDNPILYQCIFEGMNAISRRKLIQTIRFGYHIVKTDIKSIEDYNTKYPNGYSYYDLAKALEYTNVAEKLISKAATFKDCDSELLNKTFKKK